MTHQLTWENKLAAAIQGGGDLDSQFQEGLRDPGAQILLKVKSPQVVVKSPP